MVVWLLAALLVGAAGAREQPVPDGCLHGGESATEARDCPVSPGEAPTILASLLDGSLVALNKQTGATRWRLTGEPVVKSPYDPSKPVLPAFLPDPKDGALYMMGGSREDPLKKLPFTIPELVAASPSRSSEGILYTGKKVDSWLSVNTVTGARQGALSHDGCLRGEAGQCPLVQPGTVLLARTEYNIMMFDTRTRDRKWNITYYDYSSNIGGVEAAKDYDLAHFTDSSTGSLISLDKTTGSVQWDTKLNSPVVAMYQLTSESIATIPFTSVSVDTLSNLLEQMETGARDMIGETKLFPTLYVGEHEHGLFAVPSLVDEKTMMISPASNGHLLLEGPAGPTATERPDQRGQTTAGPGIPRPDKSSVLIFGYYQVPETPSTGLHSLSSSSPRIEVIEGPAGVSADQLEAEREAGRRAELQRGLHNILHLNTSFLFSKDIFVFVRQQIIPLSKEKLLGIENKEIKIAVIVFLLTVVWFVRFVKQQFKIWEKGFGRTQFSAPGSASNSLSNSSRGSSSNYEITAAPVELEDGTIRVGNISFDPAAVLGKGCEGTFVYRGRFDNRPVAVKRVLAACFSIADREVELLRESDEHQNVVRYFCMEQCRQFRYIALELCAATLQDYVEGRYTGPPLDSAAVVRQAVQGLAHLHHLDIAHRDVKPQNVLLSEPGRRGEVRAMISDFGLCKKLKVGRMSFSRRSGVAGTEGWIAPEMLLGHRSTTCCVDIFSMGCVYYYLLTGGKHPFGENFHRQANILSGKTNLGKLDQEQQQLELGLIEKMISHEPNDRPPAVAVLKHPVFWLKEKVLTFLQDVSDRVDKEEDNSVVLAAVERGGERVLGGDWQERLDPAVREDLRKHRTYRGRSVRDLLRAIRNKKHHYRELTDSARRLYGAMPAEFHDYWTGRFPRLLPHSYLAMQCCKDETNLCKYYHNGYDYVAARSRDPPVPLPGPLGPAELGPADADLFSPLYLQPTVAVERGESLVSSWSELDSGPTSRLEQLLPCEAGGGDTDQPGKEKDEVCEGDNEDQSGLCDKENVNPDIVISTDVTDMKPTKKKNKKRRKHAKKKKKEGIGDDDEEEEDEEDEEEADDEKPDHNIVLAV